MPSPNRLATTLALHASTRAAHRTLWELGRDLDHLATLAKAAPWLGLLLSCFQIVDSFRCCCGNRTSAMAAISGSLAEALACSLLGLAAGLLALAIETLLRGRLRRLELDLRLTLLELPTLLAR